MPWAHCDVAFVLDTEACPSCGFTKSEWTIELERTRTFVVSKRAKLLLQVLRERGGAELEPAAGVEWRLQPASGPAKQGATDARGESLVAAVPLGTLTLSFPKHDASSFVDPAPLGPFQLEQGREPRVVRLVLRAGDLGFELEEEPAPGRLGFELEEEPRAGRLRFELGGD